MKLVCEVCDMELYSVTAFLRSRMMLVAVGTALSLLCCLRWDQTQVYVVMHSTVASTTPKCTHLGTHCYYHMVTIHSLETILQTWTGGLITTCKVIITVNENEKQLLFSLLYFKSIKVSQLSFSECRGAFSIEKI